MATLPSSPDDNPADSVPARPTTATSGGLGVDLEHAPRPAAAAPPEVPSPATPTPSADGGNNKAGQPLGAHHGPSRQDLLASEPSEDGLIDVSTSSGVPGHDTFSTGVTSTSSFTPAPQAGQSTRSRYSREFHTPTSTSALVTLPEEPNDDPIAPLPKSQSDINISDSPRRLQHRSVSFDPTTKPAFMDGDNGIPPSFWRNQFAQPRSDYRSSGDESGVSPGQSFYQTGTSPGAIGILRLQHEGSDGETREVELEVDVDASTSSADERSADETTAIVTRERGGPRRGYGITNGADADVESEDDGPPTNQDLPKITRQSSNLLERTLSNRSRSDYDSTGINATLKRPSRASLRRSAGSPTNFNTIRATMKRQRRQRRDSSRQSRDDYTADTWYRRLADKYGSVELDNKGSVARDHLALERTFLAWLRTSLSFASIGIAVTQLFRLNTTITRGGSTDGQLRLRAVGKPLGATFIAISVLILVIGFHRYFESQHYVVRGKFPASRGSIMLVSLMAGGLIVTSLVIILVIAPRAFES